MLSDACLGLRMDSVFSVECLGGASLGGVLNITGHTQKWSSDHLLAFSSCFLSLSHVLMSMVI